MNANTVAIVFPHVAPADVLGFDIITMTVGGTVVRIQDIEASAVSADLAPATRAFYTILLDRIRAAFAAAVTASVARVADEDRAYRATPSYQREQAAQRAFRAAYLAMGPMDTLSF